MANLDTTSSYNQFLKTICENKFFYTLNANDGFAVCTSHDYAFEDDTPLKVVCFWGNEAAALNCKKAEWSKKTPFKIDLIAFMENWCPGLDEDSHLVGIDFDDKLFGLEIRPIQLLFDIIQYLKVNNIKIKLIENENIGLLEKYALDVLDN